MNESTAAYMNSLPKPDDAEGWKLRYQKMALTSLVLWGHLSVTDLDKMADEIAGEDSE